MSEPFIGEIRSFAFNFPPVNWASCFGELISITQSTTLYSLLGTRYGGDGVSSFGLPDLRGRLPMGQGQGPGLTNRYMGQLPGGEITRISIAELAPHSHVATFTPEGGGGPITIEVSTTQATLETPDNGVYLASGTNTDRAEAKMYIAEGSKGTTATLGGITGGGGGGGTVTLSDTGTGVPVEIVNPALVLNFCIAVEGLYPPRN